MSVPAAGFSGVQEPPIDPEMREWFQILDQDGSGQISWQELQCALVNIESSGFSQTACKLMISMFDKDNSQTISVQEFQTLFGYVRQWLGVFQGYDKDSSGSIEEREMCDALAKMGFRLSPDFTKILMRQCRKPGRTSLDEFMVNCLLIQHFTEKFRARDVNSRGVIDINFEDFVALFLNLLIF